MAMLIFFLLRERNNLLCAGTSSYFGETKTYFEEQLMRTKSQYDMYCHLPSWTSLLCMSVTSKTFLSDCLKSWQKIIKTSYWRKFVHLVLVNRLGGLGLPRNMWLG